MGTRYCNGIVISPIYAGGQLVFMHGSSFCIAINGRCSWLAGPWRVSLYSWSELMLLCFSLHLHTRFQSSLEECQKKSSTSLDWITTTMTDSVAFLSICRVAEPETTAECSSTARLTDSSPPSAVLWASPEAYTVWQILAPAAIYGSWTWNGPWGYVLVSLGIVERVF